LLDSACREGRFTADSALFLATWTLHDKFDFADYQQKLSPVGRVNGEVSRLLRILVKVYSSEATLPEPLQAPIGEILSTLFNSLVRANVRRPVQFDGVSRQEQDAFSDAFGRKVTDLITQVEPLLEPVAAGSTGKRESAREQHD